MSTFHFKQFSVHQGNCPMKINTDGVLLGAMAVHDNPKRILDIGTGTGAIALMLAQRYAANIHAIDIDAIAAATAEGNFAGSAFAARLAAFHASFEAYHPAVKYDMIVSNPPFFVNDYKNADPRKELARHTDANFFASLVEKSFELLEEGGKLWLILPTERAAAVTDMALQEGFFKTDEVNISSFKNKAIFRKIVCFSTTPQAPEQSNFAIYDTPGNHSEQYRALLKEFFLAY